MDDTIRDGSPADSARILDITLAAFQPAPDSMREVEHRWAAFEAPTDHRVLECQGTVIASLLITDTWVQVGGCAIRKGDIGHVAVHPDCQARGVGTALMRDTVATLRRRGHHLSRLGGLMSYYSRFGYEPFLRRTVEFPLAHMHGGRRRIDPTEAYTPPDPGDGVLRPFDETRDWQACAQVRRAFLRDRSGVVRLPAQDLPPAQPAPVIPDGLSFVYEKAGRMLGYLRAVDAPLEPHRQEDCYTITDLACLPEHPEAAGLLVRALLARLAPLGPARITARLPQDEALTTALQAAGVSFRRVEVHQAVAGNMIQVINLRALLQAVAPELTRRHAAGLLPAWSGGFTLCLPAEHCVLRVAPGSVGPTDDGPRDPALRLSQAEFMKLVLGINGFEELGVTGRAGLSVEQRAVLQALFPRCATGAGPWG